MTDTHSQEDDSPKEHPFLYYGKAAEKIIPVTAASSNPSTALNLLCYQTKHSSTLYGDNMHQQSIIEPLWEDKLSDIEDHRATVPISTPPPADSWYAIFFKTPLVPVSRGKQWHVVFSYTMAFLMVAIMSGEFMMNHELSGEFFEFDPFNFMIGPSAQTLIQSGARYPPCMRNTTAMPPEEQYICFSQPYEANGHAGIKDNNNQPDLPDFNNPRQSLCSLQHVCGMGGFLRPSVPDQTFRFITPLFVHAGLVPLLCNIAGLLTIGRSLERVTNAVRMLIIYFVAGTFGHIFGGNFVPITKLAAGSSPAVLGLAGCLLVDFALTWRFITKPKRHFVKLLLVTGLCFTMGLMPGVDNVSHVGGFLAGLLIGAICIPPAHGITRRGTLYLWMVRFAALSILITMHVVLSNRFFDRDYHYCPLCRYISCMPLNGSCRLDKT
ncbi:hypothetical protein O0I10_011607 [Lichtheimia ornata]|uniref:Rhomboid-type serine protease n=1 Tax=Lichtheimia ornata TaxID=688661 RepID=A0AAD7UUI7_9FUNG|nr:uncharacterized protein O0I10_011607 [Lichtheimia ornata]KAJ8652725.1 hypothetical protein O0I10_011607 [Lichtheimia ornata]